MEGPRFPLRIATLAVLAATLGGCVTTTKGRNLGASSGEGAERWIQASPLLREQIEDEAERLPWTHGFERLEQIRWFASVGEPAYPKLLSLATNPREDIAAAALAALGATLDRRLVPYIHDLGWSDERVRGDLGLERARTLLRLGDWSAIPTLIEGLRDDRLYTRALCLEALKEATQETLEYDPRSAPCERETAVQRWERWWLARENEGMLSAQSGG
jgi:HEAT repeat protein